MARKRKGRKGRRKMYNRKRRAAKCMYKCRKKGKVTAYARHTKSMWSKNRSAFKALMKKHGRKRGFKMIAKKISAAY